MKKIASLFSFYQKTYLDFIDYYLFHEAVLILIVKYEFKIITNKNLQH